ncbi:hypothetical protein ABEB36_001123 [Hypothenemus hampei]|uniref:C2H2-type domain-containing protein n=1 Tax=Hypothenemus hampei TaxID=57062 RepID=A0ABD1FDJ3_HYPHA
MEEPLKIYPTIEKCQIRNKVICSINGCSATFISESNLQMHLKVTHKTGCIKESPKEKWYFCPSKQCPWGHSKHFLNMKSLRQHFLKMHSFKPYLCDQCQKSFARETFFEKHKEYCNVWFKCLNCDASYGNYDTLQTHCRRKRHQLLNKSEYKSNNAKSVEINTVFLVQTKVKEICSVGTQTVPLQKNNEAQTDINYEKSTQTSCPTQEISDTSELLFDLDSPFFNCNSETQTDLMFDNELFEADYSNMYTQTCDDILSGLSDIQTQTGLNEDSLRSVESQTLMSSYSENLCPSIFKDIVHSETQTDTQFREMLEIINS